METVAAFESRAFNHTEPRDHYINPCCFGDDLARWLMDEGIDSVSLNPDSVMDTWMYLAQQNET